MWVSLCLVWVAALGQVTAPTESVPPTDSTAESAAPYTPAAAAEGAFETTPAPEITIAPPEEPLGEAPDGPKGSGPPDSPAPAPDKEGVSGALPEWWVESKDSLDKAINDQVATEGAAPPPTANTPGARDTMLGSLLRSIIALCIVVALIVLLSYGLARLGKKTPLMAGANLGTLLGRVYLTPKACLYFVRVRGKVLVVGVTANTISPVAEMDAAEFDRTADTGPGDRPPAGERTFLTQLKENLHAAGDAKTDADDDEIARLRDDVARLQASLLESSREPDDYR